MNLDGLAVFKANGEILDELSLIGQRLGRIDDALRHAALRGNKDLLRGDVGVKIVAEQGGFPAALEFRILNHAHAEIRAVGAAVFQRFDAERVEIGAAPRKIIVMLLPRLHGVVRDAGGGQNGLPQLFDSLPLRQLRKELFRPGRAGHGGDTPLILVFDLVAVGTDDLIFFLLRLGELLLIDALQTVGILGDEVDAAGDLLYIVLPAGFLPAFQRGEVLLAAPADVQLVQRLIIPVHNDALRARAVALLHHHFDKFRLIQLGGNKDLLPLLDVDAGDGDQMGVFPQNRLFHTMPPVHFSFILADSLRNCNRRGKGHCNFRHKRVK